MSQVAENLTEVGRFQPYPKYKDSGREWLGRVPDHWTIIRSKRVFALRNDKPQPSDEQLTASQEYGIVSQRDFISKAGRRVVEVVTGGDILKHVEPNDFVISMRSFQGGIERSKVRGRISSAYVMLVPSRLVEPAYFAHLLKSENYIKALQNTTNLVRDGQALRFRNFCLVDLPVLPREEQRAIADFLNRETSKIDALVAKKERLIELLQEKRTALITHAVTKGLDPNASMKPSGIDWLGEIPAHWEVGRLRFLTIVGNGSTPRRDDSRFWSDGDFPWLTSAKINEEVIAGANQFVTKRALKECHLPVVKPVSVLVAITGEGQTRGRAALLTIEATISQHLAYITPRDSRLSSEFLRRTLQSQYQWLRMESSGSGSTRPALTCDYIKSIAVPVPPRPEQERIEAWIAHNDEVIGALLGRVREGFDRLKEYRAALVSAAVTGKIDVRGLAS